jgi:dipeptidyl aminopeptidase/acylaminoacyl peptidase
MNKFLNLIILLALLIGFIACQQADQPSPPMLAAQTDCLTNGSDFLIPLVDSCRTQPFAPMGNIWTPPNDERYLYSIPIPSKSNSNFLVYIRRRTDTSGLAKAPQIWSTDLCTGEKNLLASELVSTISVSKDDWILFRRFDGNWKIKSNGDSLTQLATLITDFDWHPSGQSMIGHIGEGKWALLDEDGQMIQMLDSIQGHDTPRWSPDGTHIVFSGYTDEGAFNYLYETATQQINQIPIKLSNQVKCWADNDHLFTATSDGDLVRLNIHTHQIVAVLKPSCKNKAYVPTSLSSDGQYLFAWLELFKESQPGSSILNRYTKLVVMDIDGGNEREIVLD